MGFLVSPSEEGPWGCVADLQEVGADPWQPVPAQQYLSPGQME